MRRILPGPNRSVIGTEDLHDGAIHGNPTYFFEKSEKIFYVFKIMADVNLFAGIILKRFPRILFKIPNKIHARPRNIIHPLKTLSLLLTTRKIKFHFFPL